MIGMIWPYRKDVFNDLNPLAWDMSMFGASRVTDDPTHYVRLLITNVGYYHQSSCTNMKSIIEAERSAGEFRELKNWFDTVQVEWLSLNNGIWKQRDDEIWSVVKTVLLDNLKITNETASGCSVLVLRKFANTKWILGEAISFFSTLLNTEQTTFKHLCLNTDIGERLNHLTRDNRKLSGDWLAQTLTRYARKAVSGHIKKSIEERIQTHPHATPNIATIIWSSNLGNMHWTLQFIQLSTKMIVIAKCLKWFIIVQCQRAKDLVNSNCSENC